MDLESAEARHAVAPILVTQLLQVVEWHRIFAIVSIPGLAVVYLLYRVLRDTAPKAAAAHTATRYAQPHRWSEVFRYRNIPLNMVGMLCWLTCLVALPWLT